MSKSLGQMCLEFRAKYGLSQNAMAKHCGVHTLTIYNLEHGKSLRKTTELRIAMAMKREVNVNE